MMKRTIFVTIIVFLSVLSFAAHAAPVGKFSSVSGRVDLTRQGVPARPVHTGDEVTVGDIIRAKSKSKAEVIFVDDSILRIAQNSRVEISDYTVGKGHKSGIFNLFRGKIENVVKKSGGLFGYKKKSKFEVHTLTAVCGVRGTDFFSIHQGGLSSFIFKEGQGYGYTRNRPDDIVNISANQAMLIVNPDVPPIVRAARPEEIARHSEDTAPGKDDEGESGKKEDQKVDETAGDKRSKDESGDQKKDGDAAKEGEPGDDERKDDQRVDKEQEDQKPGGDRGEDRKPGDEEPTDRRPGDREPGDYKPGDDDRGDDRRGDYGPPPPGDYKPGDYRGEGPPPPGGDYGPYGPPPPRDYGPGDYRGEGPPPPGGEYGTYGPPPPGDYYAGDFGPGDYGPRDDMRGDYGPGDYGPGDYGPGDYGPGDYGPGGDMRGDYGPGDYGPGDYGPGDYGPGGDMRGDYGPYGPPPPGGDYGSYGPPPPGGEYGFYGPPPPGGFDGGPGDFYMGDFGPGDFYGDNFYGDFYGDPYGGDFYGDPYGGDFFNGDFKDDMGDYWGTPLDGYWGPDIGFDVSDFIEAFRVDSISISGNSGDSRFSLSMSGIYNWDPPFVYIYEDIKGQLGGNLKSGYYLGFAGAGWDKFRPELGGMASFFYVATDGTGGLIRGEISGNYYSDTRKWDVGGSLDWVELGTGLTVPGSVAAVDDYARDTYFVTGRGDFFDDSGNDVGDMNISRLGGIFDTIEEGQYWGYWRNKLEGSYTGTDEDFAGWFCQWEQYGLEEPSMVENLRLYMSAEGSDSAETASGEFDGGVTGGWVDIEHAVTGVIMGDLHGGYDPSGVSTDFFAASGGAWIDTAILMTKLAPNIMGRVNRL